MRKSENGDDERASDSASERSLILCTFRIARRLSRQSNSYS
jgi:hypothetical protein